MLTYDMNARGSASLYEHLYRCIRADIESGCIAAEEKLPSKRSLAEHLGVSLITVEGAYAQLIAEGYVRAAERRGHFACKLPERPSARTAAPSTKRDAPEASTAQHREIFADLTDGSLGSPEATAALWGRTVRAVMNEVPAEELFGTVDAAGHPRLRCAIAQHLRASRGMETSPDRIVVGAGAQLFYVLLAQMLGAGAPIAVEDPGFARIGRAYAASGLAVSYLPLDEQGIALDGVAASGARAVHVTPSHHFPTGAVMTAPRRYELLGWAAENPDRLIIEDDYDCEFRLSGRPVPAMASIDALGQVAYSNTFSKSLNAALRLAYLVLPEHLCERYRAEFDFYAPTVSPLDQIVVARLIESGDYERHVNRLRTRHRALRDELIESLRACASADRLRIVEPDAGLHFVLEVAHTESEEELARRALAHGVRLDPLGSFRAHPIERPSTAPRFVIQYGNLDPARIPETAERLCAALR